MAVINYGRAARAIVDADYLGDQAAAVKHNLTTRSLQNYRTRYREDTRLRQAVDDLRAGLQARASVEFQQARETAALEVAKRFVAAANGAARYTEAQLRDAVMERLEDVLQLVGLPSLVAASAEHTLPNGMRIDLLVEHVDQSYSIVEIKAAGGDAKKGAGWLLYGTPGQLLYYLEVLCDAYDVPVHRVNLCVLADYDPDAYYLRSIEHVTPRIRFHNVAPLLASWGIGEE
jgi:hypothetical protein